MFYNIVQIGAYVGNDDVHKIIVNEPSVNALLIEPVPWYFDKLKQNHFMCLKSLLERLEVKWVPKCLANESEEVPSCTNFLMSLK